MPTICAFRPVHRSPNLERASARPVGIVHLVRGLAEVSKGKTFRWSCAALVLAAAVVVQASAAAAVRSSGSRFVVAQQYAPSTSDPGALACAGPEFCLELALPGSSSFPTVEVLATRDAGRTWRVVSVLPFELGDLSLATQLACASPSWCVAGAQGGELAVSRSGGRSWKLVTFMPRHWALGRNVACTSSEACIAVGTYGHRVGTSWLAPHGSRFLTVPDATLPRAFAPAAIACTLPTTCLLTGSEGEINGVTLVSHGIGSGLRWIEIGTLRPHWVLRSLSCTSPTVCFGLAVRERLARRGTVLGLLGLLEAAPPHLRVVRQQVLIVRSQNGGKSWTTVARARGERLPTNITCSSVLVCATSIGLTTSGYGTGGTIYISSSGSEAPLRRHEGAGSVPTMTTTEGGRRWLTHPVLPAVPGDPMVGAAACLTSGECLADAADASAQGGRTEVGLPNGRWLLLNTQSAAVQPLSFVCTASTTCLRIDAYQGLHGFVAALLESHDNGATWSPVALPSGLEPALIGGCQDKTTCEVVAVRGVRLQGGELGIPDYSTSTTELLVTTDGGVDWVATPVGSQEDPVAASCSSTVQCSVLMQVGTSNENLPDYLDSTQDGHDWSRTPVEPPFGGFGLFGATGVVLTCAAPSTCLFADDAGITTGSTLLRSEDGGATWIVATPPGPRGDEIIGASCVSGSTCDLAYSPNYGGLSRLVQTNDAGATWTPPVAIPSSRNFGLSAITCPTTSSCTAVLSSRRGAPFAESTENLGASWSAIRGPSSRPTGLSGFASTDGLACSTSTCLVAETVVGIPFPLFSGVTGLQTTTQLLRLTP